jgi:hypothetical protein
VVDITQLNEILWELRISKNAINHTNIGYEIAFESVNFSKYIITSNFIVSLENHARCTSFPSNKVFLQTGLIRRNKSLGLGQTCRLQNQTQVTICHYIIIYLS